MRRFQPTYEELKPCSKIAKPKLFSGFQPTYEELKHSLGVVSEKSAKVSSLPMRNWNGRDDTRSIDLCPGFQPTYEELKPTGVSGVNRPEARFQPTYEELKQVEGV